MTALGWVVVGLAVASAALVVLFCAFASSARDGAAKYREEWRQ